MYGNASNVLHAELTHFTSRTLLFQGLLWIVGDWLTFAGTCQINGVVGRTWALGGELESHDRLQQYQSTPFSRQKFDFPVHVEPEKYRTLPGSPEIGTASW